MTAAAYVLTADHMYVEVDGSRRHFVRGDELPPIEDAEDVDRLTRCGAIVPKGTPVPPRAFEAPPGSVLPDQIPTTAEAEAAAEVGDDGDDPAAEPDGAPQRPKQVSPVSEWRAWAKAAGYDEDQVDASTKKELMDLE